MPLRWNIDHENKLLHVVAEGPVSLKDMEAHFDAIVIENALSYAKLFDGSAGWPELSDHDILMLGARLSAYTETFENGPLAVVGDGDLARFSFRRFVNISPSKRPARLFRTEADARAWLMSQLES